MNNESNVTKVYEKLQIVSEEIFERTALACSTAIFYNTLVNVKYKVNTCDYNDSKTLSL